MFFDGDQIHYDTDRKVLNKDNTAWMNITKYLLFFDQGIDELK